MAATSPSTTAPSPRPSPSPNPNPRPRPHPQPQPQPHPNRTSDPNPNQVRRLRLQVCLRPALRRRELRAQAISRVAEAARHAPEMVVPADVVPADGGACRRSCLLTQGPTRWPQATARWSYGAGLLAGLYARPAFLPPRTRQHCAISRAGTRPPARFPWPIAAPTPTAASFSSRRSLARSKWHLGTARVRLVRLLRARLSVPDGLGSRRERDLPNRSLATASGARSNAPSPNSIRLLSTLQAAGGPPRRQARGLRPRGRGDGRRQEDRGVRHSDGRHTAAAVHL